MTGVCDNNIMPRGCAEKFEEFSRLLAKLDSVAEDVAVLRKAVVGNGDAAHSLAHRLRRLEECKEIDHGVKVRWRNRLWRLLVAVGLVLFGWWLKS